MKTTALRPDVKTDATRPRRTRDAARKAWYARYRTQRFSRRCFGA